MDVGLRQATQYVGYTEAAAMTCMIVQGQRAMKFEYCHRPHHFGGSRPCHNWTWCGLVLKSKEEVVVEGRELVLGEVIAENLGQSQMVSQKSNATHHLRFHPSVLCKPHQRSVGHFQHPILVSASLHFLWHLLSINAKLD